MEPNTPRSDSSGTSEDVAWETRSNASVSSITSSHSSIGSMVVQARAEAQAALARAEYAKREIQLKVERARLEAEIEALGHEKEARATTVRAEALERAMSELSLHGSSRGSHVSKVQAYLDHQSESKYPRDIMEQPHEQVTQYMDQPQDCSTQGKDNNANSSNNSNNIDLAKFLTRTQLVAGGLYSFDDQPESYLGWKATFLNVVESLSLTCPEQIDLLIRWLGRESSRQARRIKSVNVNNPAVGLKMIWVRLEESFGAPEAIERALFAKIDNFPKIHFKDSEKLRELGDLLYELEAAKQDGYLAGLAYLDTPRGVCPIVEKLPFQLQEKWRSIGSKYKEENGVIFPPFRVFCDFIRREAKSRNDPSFSFATSSAVVKKEKPGGNTRIISVNKTSVMDDPSKECPVHKKPHPLKKCKAFKSMSYEDRKRILKENKICFRCCDSTSHLARKCSEVVRCEVCDSERHVSAMHPDDTINNPVEPNTTADHGGEPDPTTMCTKVCGSGFSKSCAKICLVRVYPDGYHNKATNMYVILDDQSNVSLAKSKFFKIFGIETPVLPYTMKTCTGIASIAGRRAQGFVIEDLDGTTSIRLPTLIECNEIPNNRGEIPTPEAAYHHNHMRDIAKEIPALDPTADILLLLGRDVLRVHKVRKQINGPHDAPFAQKLDLGWVIIGDVCLGGAHVPTVTTMKTCVLENGRYSNLVPCESSLTVKENYRESLPVLPLNSRHKETEEKLGEAIFQTSDKDNQIAPSIEDNIFLQIMEKGVEKDDNNSWVAPLPFRTPRKKLPNNRSYAFKRLMSLRRSLERKPGMKTQYLQFMQSMIDNNHAEVAPPIQEGKEYWYLPTFGVYHPQKPGQIRVVFDSSAKFEGSSLNDVLLSGPDLNNSLLGVLLRFRKEPVAVTADIQQMFYCFVVQEDHRDYLRFLWYRDNNFDNEIIDYRMRVHVFGNSPSPSVATYGLRKAAQEADSSDVHLFVERDFYVDDALKSFATESEAIDVIQRTRDVLARSNIKLHKIASNIPNVMAAFPVEDRAKDVKQLDLSVDELPVQRSLGVSWNMMSDTFTFQIPEDQKPFTRRGVLSTVNSIFDPLGFLAPVTIQGRHILRELTAQNSDWDTPLPDSKYVEWKNWQDSLCLLTELEIPRMYTNVPLSHAKHTELCVFSDASVKAIAAVAYLKVTDKDDHYHLGFVLGKAKLAPLGGLTIPRLELCAAVLAVEIADSVREELDLSFDTVTFYSDSKVVLGYIHNETRRFHVYVNNRVQRIRKSSHPIQWKYVSTKQNPADHGSRSVKASSLKDTNWLFGPSFLTESTTNQMPEENDRYDLIDPDSDAEIRRENAEQRHTNGSRNVLGSKRFERFSSWSSLVKAVAALKHVARQGLHTYSYISSELYQEAEKHVIRELQKEVYSEELHSLKHNRHVPLSSTIASLNPYLDTEGLLRVGGRIKNASIPDNEKNPIVIPGNSHIGKLLVRHYHSKVKHQGRHFTEGAIREGGIWLVGAKKVINSIIHKCVTCRKLRAKPEQQLMSDLPPERVQHDPPFTYVGVDVFGPWEVTTRKTRGGSADSKRWAMLFTCMSTRAVHIEVIETMSSSSCINALRRFFSIRGPAKQIRSDCGTNFVGAVKEMKQYLLNQNCTWVFNPPHASNMGGAWERMIGIARRILDSMLLERGKVKLTHEVLCTLMAEIVAIMNSRPLVPVSSDSEAPLLLTPSMLLSQKICNNDPAMGDFPETDIFKHQWKRVQILANMFWARWRKEYLATLQSRTKWQKKSPNITEGDVVLLKDKQVQRKEWPVGVVTKTFHDDDDIVRKAEVRVTSGQDSKIFLRPISDLVILVASGQTD